MKYSAIVMSLAASILLSACATTYQSVGATGGYSETRLDEKVFRVSFKGNGYTSQERASDFALLRCAEIALQHGYEYFAIIDEQNYTKNSTYTTPTTSSTTANIYGSGNYAYGTATTTTSGGQTYNIAKPRTMNTIILLDNKPEEGFAYNAKFIYRELRAKYEIGEE